LLTTFEYSLSSLLVFTGVVAKQYQVPIHGAEVCV
jgi:hypothetical protein